jgi:hypothetical protein
MKKEIAQIVLNSLSSNPVMIERAALMQERWHGINLNEIATPIIKRIFIDIDGIQKFLEEKYPGIKFSYLGIEITNQKFEPVLSFKEEHEDFWTAKSSERWYSDEYSFEEKEGWYKWRKDYNYYNLEFGKLGIPEELYQIEWL